MKVLVEHPTRAQEAEIARRMGIDPPSATLVIPPEHLGALQRDADRVFVHDAIIDYAVRLVFATREPDREGLQDLGPLIAHGASPRATLALLSTSRALALMRGRRYVVPQDVYDVGPEVLRHRILLGYEALAEGVEVETVVHRIMRTVVAPRVSPAQDDARIAIAS
jgi:MoxR-like ATPase